MRILTGIRDNMDSILESQATTDLRLLPGKEQRNTTF